MKKSITLLLAAGISVFSLAQNKLSYVMPRAIPLDSITRLVMPAQTFNPKANTKSVMEDVIGTTYYDMQQNMAIDTRIRVFPDNTVSGVWIHGTILPNQRGTGYNHYDGSAWGPAPTQRIESVRTGYPSFDHWKGSGEIIISHASTLGPLVMNTRPVKGTGAWTQSFVPKPAGVTGFYWPRVMTSGPDNNVVHLFALTARIQNGGTVYHGLNGALLYFRSSDGGTTWDKNGIQFPGLDSVNYYGFLGDQYNWGTPHGDTIYFTYSGPWDDTFVMVSYDNGENWTKIPVLSNANKKLPAGITYVPPFRASDGACAVEMDHQGVFHLAFGIGGGYMLNGDRYIISNRNGLVYWNSTMPMIEDSLDPDVLEANGQLLAAVYDGPNPGDTIIAAPDYWVSLSSQPQITIDEWNNIYFTWSAVTPGHPYIGNLNYRHIWGRAKFHDKPGMTVMTDFNSDNSYWFREFAYPAMAKKVVNGKLLLLYQTSTQPGSNQASSSIPMHECDIEYREIPVSDFWPTGVQEKKPKEVIVSQNYPNPVNRITRFNITLGTAASVTADVLNVTGHSIMTLDMGMMHAGRNQVRLDLSHFTPGVYFCKFNIDGEIITRKIIVGQSSGSCRNN